MPAIYMHNLRLNLLRKDGYSRDNTITESSISCIKNNQGSILRKESTKVRNVLNRQSAGANKVLYNKNNQNLIAKIIN